MPILYSQSVPFKTNFFREAGRILFLPFLFELKENGNGKISNENIAEETNLRRIFDKFQKSLEMAKNVRAGM